MILEPAVTDVSGYEISVADLTFLNIGIDSFTSWSRHEAPLTIAHEDYLELCSTLFDALEADNIHDADVRIQGSSVRFFSSLFKPMLYERTQLVSEFISQYGRMPSPYEVNRMMATLNSQWSAPGPNQRPFDAMFVIGAATDASDLDFQISSEDARRHLEWAAQALGANLSDLKAEHPKYNFFIKELTESEFPHLSLWRTKATELVRRPVSLAMFDSGGPPKFDGPVSSHFKEDDWRVIRDEQSRN